MILNVFIFSTSLNGQVALRDVYGNPLPSTWPPPDSTYEHNSLTIWFNRNAINKEFLCNYWYYYYNPPKIEGDEKNEKLLTEPYTDAPGCFNLTPLLFTDYELFQTLDSLGVKTLCQYSMLNPCEDTLALTHYGYYIKTPEFWNSFYVTFDSDISLAALLTLLLKYGGTKIDFAELNFYSQAGSDRRPNDPLYNDSSQTCYGEKSYAENIVGAWDYETGKREIKVAIIDQSIDYMHPDFGSGKGFNYPIYGGEEILKDGDNLFRRFTYDTTYIYDKSLNLMYNSHGTALAGMICAKTNNTIGISGIAGGWSDTLGISLYSMGGSDVFDSVDNCTPVRNQLFIDAVSKTVNSNDTFQVNIVNLSWYSYHYSNFLRSILDYAYRLGVVTCAIKSNHGYLKNFFPADYEYNKVICVGGYGAYHEFGDPLKPLIPTLKIKLPYGSGECDNSNFGFGLDILAFSDPCSYPESITNITTIAPFYGGGYEPEDGTSIACPQVVGVASLILSYFYRIDHSRFHNYEIHSDSLIRYLSPEDVEAILCISALDCNFNYLDTIIKKVII